ncbi:DUF4956 domain-containing protein [Tissierella sp. Yu-01]|uniref:DUF4956 domain-containing protein n=1 Tax=Tissierella sp. Yu-01 TaxID=3035694 RepID=UPI00240DD519|nr:DUF4956 domain-containing protein [Tissierella sp. Yu-01]WFA10147.1 DUF4956 domain-containing protein [Tissierella sp. Yu-01]
MTTFQDIFKKTFLENVQNISIVEAVTSMSMALLLGLIIYITYKYTFSGVIYSKNYNSSLLTACVITSVIVITISSNIVLSLGMVGALSIVRFRTAVKEALDVVYMFWAITVGIVCGAGLYLFGALSTIIVSLLLAILSKTKERNNKFILIINFSKNAYNEVEKVLSNTKYILRTKTITNDAIELVLELNIKKNNSTFVNQISEIEDVDNVSLVNYKSGV